MNRAGQELDRLSAGAWRRLSRGVTRAGRHLGQVASAGARKHPGLVLGGAALLAVFAVSRLRRPPPAVVECARGGRNPGRIASTLALVGRILLTRALSSPSTPGGIRPSNGSRTKC